MGIFATLRHLNRSKNRYLKKIKLKIKFLYFSAFFRKKSILKPEEIKSVCLLMHKQAIGDSIVTSGFIKRLKDKGIRVYVVAPEKLEFLFSGIIEVDKFFSYHDKKNRALHCELKKLEIDLVVDFFDIDTTSLHRLRTLFLIRPKHAIGFNQLDISNFDTNIIDTRDIHVTQRMIKVLDLLQIDSSHYTAYLNLSANDYPEAYALAATIKQKYKNLVIFNPFGSQKNRVLSVEQINKVLQHLNAIPGFYTVVFNMGKTIECAHLENVALSPFKDIGNSFALVRSADVVITVDTAIVHLASLYNIRQYCIYNNRRHINKYDNNIMWGPNSDKAVQLFTSEFLGTEGGDNMDKFDVSLLLNAIDNDIKKGVISR